MIGDIINLIAIARSSVIVNCLMFFDIEFASSYPININDVIVYKLAIFAKVYSPVISMSRFLNIKASNNANINGIDFAITKLRSLDHLL